MAVRPRDCCSIGCAAVLAEPRTCGLDCRYSTAAPAPSSSNASMMCETGFSLSQVAAKTDIFEGSIIRVARRLDELMQQLARAARVIGDEKLAVRFEESNDTLRRGIMFSASLYL